MTQQECNVGAGVQWRPLRHCEARSAVAIRAFVRRLMDRFVPRDDGVGA
jgi:hypothetical protein